MSQLAAITFFVTKQEAIANLAKQALVARLNLLVEHRQKSNVSKFAEKLTDAGVKTNEATVRNWLRGSFAKGFLTNHLWAIGKAYPEISIDWLLGVSGPVKEWDEILHKILTQKSG